MPTSPLVEHSFDTDRPTKKALVLISTRNRISLKDQARKSIKSALFMDTVIYAGGYIEIKLPDGRSTTLDINNLPFST